MKLKKLGAVISVIAMAASVFTAFPSSALTPMISKSGFKVSATSGSEEGIAKLIDGDYGNYWHSSYEAENGTITKQDMPPYKITVDMGKATVISGIVYTPRQDGSFIGIVKGYKIYAEKPGTDKLDMIYSGQMPGNASTVTVEFGFNVKTDKIVFEITESVANFGSCAELDFLGEVKKLETKELTGTGASLADVSSGKSESKTNTVKLEGVTVKATSGNAEKAFDGDKSTYWHSWYSSEGGNITKQDKPPYRITVTFDKETTLSGFIYTPRQDGSFIGIVKGYKLYGIANGKTEEVLLKSGEMPGNATEITVDLGYNVKVKTLIFEITASVADFGSMAEFTPLGENKAYSLKPLAPEEEIKLDFKATANSGSEASVMKAFDNNMSTYWHSAYTAEGSEITSKDDPPFEVKVVFDNPTYVSGINYVPRQDQNTGRFLEYNLYGLDSEDGERVLLTSGTWTDTADKKHIDFYINAKLKGFILEGTATARSYGTAAEIEILRENKEYKEKAESAAEFKEVYDRARPHIVDSSVFIVTDYSRWGDSFAGSMAFDGKSSTYYHSDAKQQNKYPVVLDVDMTKVHTVTGFDYLPRFNDLFGHWYTFTLESSTDGQNYTKVADYEIKKDEMSFAVKSFKFENPVTARFLRFTVNSSYAGFVSASEITIYETYESALSAEGEKEKYVLKIGSPEIKTEKGEKSETVTIDVVPVIDNSRTMIPLRGLLEAMGATLTWDGEAQKITVTKEETVIEMQIYNKLVYVKKYLGGKYRDLRYTMDTPPKIRDSRTLIPVRFVSEHLGYNVTWNAETQEIIITSK